MVLARRRSSFAVSPLAKENDLKTSSKRNINMNVLSKSYYFAVLVLASAVTITSTTAFVAPPSGRSELMIKRLNDSGRMQRTHFFVARENGVEASSSSRKPFKGGQTNNPNRPARKGPSPKGRQGKAPDRKKHKGGSKRNSLYGAKILNQKLTSCQSAQDVLTVLASTDNALTALAAGGSMNSVNFSTGLHRIGRHAFRDDGRATAFKDPRFALFMSSLSEAISGLDYTQSLKDLQTLIEQQEQLVGLPGKQTISFHTRELSNVAWAIAKLRLAPPQTTLPIDASEKVREDLVKMSYLLRNQVLEAARSRKQGQSSVDRPWVPTLSKMSALIMDTITHNILATEMTFSTQECANLMWAFATAGRADKRVFDVMSKEMLNAVDKQLKEGVPIRPQELSNTLWAFATAGVHGESEENLIRYVADLFDADQDFVSQYKPQELSNTVWAIATIASNKSGSSDDGAVLRILRHVALSIERRADEFKSQELANTVWAFATLGFGSDGSESANTLNDYIYLASDDLIGDKDLVSRALDTVAKSSLRRLNVFRPQELNNLAWAFARLDQPDSEALYAGIGREFRQKRRRFSPQDIGTTLWSFATMGYFDEDIYRIISSRLTIAEGSRFKPQEMSNTVWALATAQILPKYPDAFDVTLVPPSMRMPLSEMSDDPTTLCFAAAANELMRRPHEFKEQEIKDILWSFSKIGIRHPALFKKVAEHLVGPESELDNNGRGLAKFSPQGVGNLSWSYAKQAQLASVAVNRIEGISRDTTGRLATYATVCIDIGEVQIQRLFRRIANSALEDQDGLKRLKPQDMSNTAWAFAVLGLFHQGFFEAAAAEIMERVTRYVSKKPDDKSLDYMCRFKGQELANIIWAFATLNCSVPGMLDAIAPYILLICKSDSSSSDSGYDVHSIARQFKRQELANIVWSCAVLAVSPLELMRLLYAGLVGVDNESTPEYMSIVYGDGGLQKQAIMTMLYVQMVGDIEAPDNQLTLPPNFPEGWDSLSPFFTSPIISDADVSSASMLTLSSSKIQKDVSACFRRIGFEHVQEHVIATEELAQEYGIRLSSAPLEILSIDIANLNEKIGIEVDGPAHFFTVLDDEKDLAKDEPRGYAKVVNGKLEWQFLWQGRQQMNGPTALKGRLLRHFGWDIIHLPFWEWYQLSSENEDDYCTSLLKRASRSESVENLS